MYGNSMTSNTPNRGTAANEQPSGLITSRPQGLVDLLDRILDKGLVIVGDIKISLTNVELLTLQIRLLVCSIDKAEQLGINWWRFDPNLSSAAAANQLKAKAEEDELAATPSDTPPPDADRPDGA